MTRLLRTEQINKDAATSSHVTARLSSTSKKRELFASYDTHIEADIDPCASEPQSAATVVMLYVNNLKGFFTQAGRSDKSWDVFKADGRFCEIA